MSDPPGLYRGDHSEQIMGSEPPAGSAPANHANAAPATRRGLADDGMDRVDEAGPAMQKDAARQSAMAAPTRSSPWEESGAPERAEDLPIHSIVTERSRVKVHRGQLADLKIGDVMPLPIPGQGTLLARVEHLISSPRGDRCWRGHLTEGGVRYPVVYTEGPKLTFATIVTPEGPYALQANGDLGHLFKDTRSDLAHPDKCELIH